MRISDWSSDVCSSDLLVAAPGDQVIDLVVVDALQRDGVDLHLQAGVLGGGEAVHHLVELAPAGDRLELRSEEHTSELQSLMRISYAVFCLKKNKKQQQHKKKNNYKLFTLITYKSHL